MSERYVTVGQPFPGQGRYCTTVRIRFEDTAERELLKANGYQWNAAMNCWQKPGKIEDITAEFAALLARGYSVPNPRLINGQPATRDVLAALGMNASDVYVYPNPLFS